MSEQGDKARADIEQLLSAMNDLYQTADHIGSGIYDWRRLLPEHGTAVREAIDRVERNTLPEETP